MHTKVTCALNALVAARSFCLTYFSELHDRWCFDGQKGFHNFQFRVFRDVVTCFIFLQFDGETSSTFFFTPKNSICRQNLRGAGVCAHTFFATQQDERGLAKGGDAYCGEPGIQGPPRREGSSRRWERAKCRRARGFEKRMKSSGFAGVVLTIKVCVCRVDEKSSQCREAQVSSDQIRELKTKEARQ